MASLATHFLEKRNITLEEAGSDGGKGGTGTGSSGDGDAGKTGEEGGEGDSKAGEEGGAGKGGDEGGKGKPSDETAKLLKEVMEKKAKIKELQDAAKAAADKLKEFDGIDPKAVKEILAERKSAEERKLAEAGHWDALKKQMNDAHTAEIDKLKAETTTERLAREALENKIAELTVGNSFGTSAFIREEMALTPSKARIVYGSHFEFDGERVVGYDKPAGSKDRVQLVDGKGDPLSFEQALKKLVEADPDRDQLLRSKKSTGAGSRSEEKGKPASKTTELSAREKIAAGLKGGLKK
jgi:hypothetical protein